MRCKIAEVACCLEPLLTNFGLSECIKHVALALFLSNATEHRKKPAFRETF